MGAKSRHYGDVAIWIENVIKSCTTIHQLLGANRLIRNYNDMFYNYDVKLTDDDYHNNVIRHLSMDLSFTYIQQLQTIRKSDDTGTRTEITE